MSDAKKALVDMLKGDSHAFMLFREEAEAIDAAWTADRDRAEKAEASVKVLEAVEMAAEDARTRLNSFADAANAGKIHYSARELKRKIWGAFSDFEAARAAKEQS